MDPDAPLDLARLEKFDRGNSAIPEGSRNSEPSPFIPRYFVPEKACDFCAARQLECKVFLVNGNKACLSCNALFRSCSFEHGHQPGNDVGYGGMETLCVVEEESECGFGKNSPHCPLEEWKEQAVPGISASAGTRREKSSGRFSRPTLHILKRWLDDHSDMPYPTEEEKEQLKDQTGLTRSQISNWLANARRRGKAKCKQNNSTNSVASTFSRAASSQPIAIPPYYGVPDQSNLTPFERWRDSPPDDEPCCANAIACAMADPDFLVDGSRTSSSRTHSLAENRHSSHGDSSYSQPRAPSSTSVESALSSHSNSGSVSLQSHASSRGSYGSFAKRDRRRRKRTATPIPRSRQPGSLSKSKHDNPRIFQCTFCTDSFQTKYDWQRHEKSLHLNLEKWVCCPDGPVVPSTTLQPTSTGTMCAYCATPDPDPIHLMEAHDHDACVEKSPTSRAFHRKDHLRQHLRLVHSVPTVLPHMGAWKSTPAVIRSRCGFCDQSFTAWDERNAHLSAHFREGRTMTEWKGDWGFDAAVYNEVRDAIQPFLIGEETKTPLPFSTEKGETWAYKLEELRETLGVPAVSAEDEGPAPMMARGVYPVLWDDKGWSGVFAAGLALAVGRCQEEGKDMTDDLIQDQARLILYGSTDRWNQTEADNPEWLRIFKEQIGLTMDPG